MKIPPKIKQEVEAVINQTIPDPLTKDYDAFIEALRGTHPDEAEKLERSYDFSGFGDPFSKAQAVSNRRKQRDGLLHYMFMRKTATGRWTPARGKLLTWGSTLLAGLFALLLANIFWKPTVAGGATPVVNAQGSDSEIQAASLEQPSFGQDGVNDVDPFAGYQGSPFLSSDTVSTPTTVTQGAPLQNTPSQAPALPSERRDVNAPESLVQQQANPPAPTTTGVVGLNVFAGEVPSGVTLSGGETAEAVSLRSSSGSTANILGSSRAAPQTVGLFVFSGETTSAQPEQSADGFALPDKEDAVPQAPVAETPQPTSDEGVTDKFAQVPQDAPTLPVPENSAASAKEPPAPTTHGYQSGETVAASLEVGLVFVEGANEASGVIAKGDDNSVWIGDALLERSGRVTISFDQVVVEGQTFDVQASALAEDGYAGLSATTRETTPSLASDLARGAMRGVADYVEQLGKSKTVVLQGNTPVVTSQSVPIESSVLGSVSQLFAPPQGDAQQAIVRVSELAPGTRFRLLVVL
jgi:hypothetical protein